MDRAFWQSPHNSGNIDMYGGQEARDFHIADEEGGWLLPLRGSFSLSMASLASLHYHAALFLSSVLASARRQAAMSRWRRDGFRRAEMAAPIMVLSPTLRHRAAHASQKASLSLIMTVISQLSTGGRLASAGANILPSTPPSRRISAHHMT